MSKPVLCPHILRSFSHQCLAFSVLAAYLAAFLALNVAGPPRCAVGAEEDVGCARGFETRERAGERSFRWTDGDASVRLHAAGYGAPLLAEVSLAAPRPDGSPSVSATIAVGATRATFAAGPDPRRYLLLTPSAPLVGDIATLTVASDTWRPQGDRRALGVQVLDVRLRALGGPRLPGMFHALALLAIGLAAASLTAEGRGTKDEGPRPRGVGLWSVVCGLPSSVVGCWSSLVAIALAALLWALLPERVAPFLPGLALLLGAAALANRFARRTVTPRGSPLLWQGAVAGGEGNGLHVGKTMLAAAREERAFPAVLLLAVAGSAALDAGLAVGLVRGAWVAPALLAQGLLTLWAIWRASLAPRPLSLAQLLGVALAVRLLALAARLLTGSAGTDPDVELFYSYGRATVELGVPVTEYPSGALIPWALLALPASRELFALLLPLLNTACDLAIVWGVWVISAACWDRAAIPSLAAEMAPQAPRASEAHDARLAAHDSILPLFYALSPLLLPFWYGKYDSLPAALLVLGLAALAAGRPLLSGAALGLGGAVKWVPWLAAPLVGLHLLLGPRPRTKGEGPKTDRAQRTKDRRPNAGALRLWSLVSRHWPAVRFALGGVLVIGAASLPFALRDQGAFLAPYTFQGGRPIIGESVWFLPAVLMDPGLLAELPSPWSGVQSPPFPPALTLLGQALVLIALALPSLLRPDDARRALVAAALVPAAFLLLNRVFSPQYVLIITAAALAAGAAVLRGREPLALIALLVVAQAGNLLVWPFTARLWLLPSAALFASAIAALAWLALRSARLKSWPGYTRAVRPMP